MYKIRGYIQNLCCILLFMAAAMTAVFGQSVTDTVPTSGHRDIYTCSGTIVPPTDNTGYCITNSDGSITIHPSQGCRIHLEGAYFISNYYTTGIIPEYYRDYLTVYDGPNTSSTVIKNVTGYGYLDITSTDAITIRFKSNSILQYAGFRLQYTCVAGCGCNNDYPLKFQWANDSLTVEWIASLPNSGVSGYSLEYGIHGFAPGSGTTISNISTNHYTIGRLLEDQLYDFYLTYNCSSNSNPVVDSFLVPHFTECIDMRNLQAPNIICTTSPQTYTPGAINPYALTGYDAHHHAVISQQGYDTYSGSLLKFIPDGETYSIKLGNDSRNEGESISYTFTVDTNEADIILLKYACIMEDPNHRPEDQPRFDLEILNSNGQLMDPDCGYAKFIASQDLDWNVFPFRDGYVNGTSPAYKSHTIRWKDWTNVGLNISQYHGQVITIRLTTRDCGEGEHFGYAYFHLGCLKQNLSVERCGNVDINTFTAPTGFKYNWYYQDRQDSLIGNGQSITLPMDSTRELSCFVESKENPNCGFWLHGALRPVIPVADFSMERNDCSRSYTFHNDSYISNGSLMPFATVCENAFWDFGDGGTSNHYNATHTYDQPGSYDITLISSMYHGDCQDTLTQTLIVPVDTTDFSDFGCETYTWNGITYDTPGDHTQNISRPNGGCDSVVTLHLTLYPTYLDTIEKNICGCDLPMQYGDSIFPIETRTGFYPVTFHSIHGCDSTIMLHFFVNPPFISLDTITICEREFDEMGSQYTYGDSIFTESCTKRVTFIDPYHGCDSVIIVTFNINPTTYGTYTIDTCDSYTWLNGRTYTESNYTDTIIRSNVFGCDSIITLNLTLRKSTSGIDSLVVCDSLTWIDGNTYTRDTSGVTYHITNAAGCDSLVTLKLTVHPSYDTTVIIHICRNELPISYKDTTFQVGSRNGFYNLQRTNQYGCDSLIRIQLFIHDTIYEHEYLRLQDSNLPFYYTEHDTTFEAGTYSRSYFFHYQTLFGCDSTFELHLTIELAGSTTGGINTVCNGDETVPTTCNGFAVAQARGGRPPYQYQWNDPLRQTTDTAFHLCEGDYRVTVTSDDGQRITLSYHVGNFVSDTTAVFDTIGTSQIPYSYHGNIFSTAINDSLLTIQNNDGCDSIVRYSLFIIDNVSAHYDTTVCAESLPINWHDRDFGTIGHFKDSVVLENQSYLIRTFDIDTFITRRTDIWDTICGTIVWNNILCDSTKAYTVRLPDVHGCDSIVTLHLFIREFPNPITSVNIPNICAGSTESITIGHRSSCNIFFASVADATISVSETVFLPDGQACGDMGCSYISPIHFSNFSANSGITSVNDIQYVRLNIEHSCIRDLYIKLTCPNGQSADILKFADNTSPDYISNCAANIGAVHKGWQVMQGQSNVSTGRTYLGTPGTTDNTNYPCNSAYNRPGSGWNYCWSDNTVSGYSYGNTNSPNDDLIYRSANKNAQGSIIASNLTNKTHFYKPDQSFQSFVGCPLNGNWTIEVMDGMRTDNGYLFNWELSLSPELLHISTFHIDSVTLSGPWAVRNNDSTYTVMPPDTLTSDTLVEYLISVFSDDCRYDTLVHIWVNTKRYEDLYDTICRTDLPYEWHGLSIYDTLYTAAPITASNGCDSIITLHLTFTDSTHSHIRDTIGIRDLPYTFNGCTFRHAVTDTLIVIENHVHCDSVIHYSLLLYPNTRDTIDTLICAEAFPLRWHGHYFQHDRQYFTDTTYNESGSYLFTCYHIGSRPVMHSQLSHNLPSLCLGDSLDLTVGTLSSNDLWIHYVNNANEALTLSQTSIVGYGVSSRSDSVFLIKPRNLYTDTTLSYSITTFSQYGCRYDTLIQLQIVTQRHIFTYDTICKEALPYIDGNDTIEAVGIHRLSDRIYPCSNGCDSIVTPILLVTELHNPITHLNLPSICCGDTATIDFGHTHQNNVTIFTQAITRHEQDTIFLPDSIECPPYGNEYRSNQLFTEFPNGSTIRNADDILYLRLKIEHSACEDLEIKLACPNNTSCRILPRHCTDSVRNTNPTQPSYFRVNFGVARRDIDQLDCDPALNPIGIPWNYVWSCNNNQGYGYAGGAHHYCYENIHLTPNPIWDNEVSTLIGKSFKMDSSNVASMQNIYRPVEDFSRLVGCPLNGTWSIVVKDWLPNDNGYLTEWELGLSSDLYQNIENTVTRVSLHGPWVEPLTDSSFNVMPPSTLANDTIIPYEATFYNALGCRFDTTLSIQFYALRYSDTTVTACDSFAWNGNTYRTSGNYSKVLTSSTGCDSTARLHLTINLSKHDTIRDNVCLGHPYQAYGFSIPESRTQVARTIVDTLNLTAANDCDSTSILILTVNAPPTLTVCNDTIIENGGAAHLHVTGADHYLWSPANTLSSDTSANPIASPTESTYYQVEASQTHGTVSCLNMDSVRVLVYHDLDTTICHGTLPMTWHGLSFNDTTEQRTTITHTDGSIEAVILHVHYFPSHSTIVRDTVVQDSLPVLYNGTFFIEDASDSLFTLTDQNGCDSIVHYSLVIFWNTDTIIRRDICQNDVPFIWNDTALYNNTILIDTMLAENGTDSIVMLKLYIHSTYDTTLVDNVCEDEAYHKNGFAVSANETHGVDSVAKMQALTSSFGCDSIVRLKLNVIQAHPQISSLTGDFCEQSFDILSVDDRFEDYFWNTGENNPSIEIHSPGYYAVTVTNGNCTGEAHYTVQACEWAIYLPNAITPSRPDKMNDIFQIDERAKGLIDDEKFAIRIFNRWGELVFYSTDKNFQWNGEFNGKTVYNTVYVYTIDCFDRDGRYHSLKGTITVL